MFAKKGFIDLDVFTCLGTFNISTVKGGDGGDMAQIVVWGLFQYLSVVT